MYDIDGQIMSVSSFRLLFNLSVILATKAVSTPKWQGNVKHRSQVSFKTHTPSHEVELISAILHLVPRYLVVILYT